MIKIQNQLDRFQNIVVSGFYYVLRIALSIGAGYLSAKCTLFENFSPFSIILIAVCPKMGIIPTFCYLGSAFGHLNSPFRLSVFKYITALTMLYIVYMVFRKSQYIQKNNIAVLASVSCFTSGFLVLLVGQLNLYNVLMLIGECILICCCVYFVTYALNGFRQYSYLTSRELIAAAITLILILISLHNVYLFQMSVARIVAMILIFLALNCLKISHTAVLGSCLGIILSAVANGGEAIFTAIIVGTLVGCVFSTFSERFALAAFVIVYYAILLFFGRFPWNYWYFCEPLVSYSLVIFMPKDKLRHLLSTYIPVKKAKTKRNEQYKELFEACKNECDLFCPKAKICYQKNGDELMESIESLLEKYKQSEDLGDIEEAILFCIKPHTMAKIIEKRLIYCHSEAFDDLVLQLDHLSKKLEIKMDASAQAIHFLTEEENQIKICLEKRKLSVKEINFIVDQDDCRKCDIQFNVNGDVLYEKIIKEVVAPYFSTGFTTRITENEGDYAAYIKECSRFNISCAALCKTKNGEKISGDTALGFSAGKGIYYLMLADGMGSGKEAGIQSELVINSLQRLITGGLSVSGALNIYRAASRLRHTDSFATIDICRLDLNLGMAEFYKAGAYDSFYVHEDEIASISGGGIPLGLGEKDRLCHHNIKVNDGDYLVLASDGISVLNDNLKQILLQSISQDVRLYAERILHAVSQESDGAGDDVTVMVCRFHKVTE